MTIRKIISPFLFIALVICMLTGLASCGGHNCDYCGDEAVWSAQEWTLGLEPSSAKKYYVCAACKRDGKGPRVIASGNSIHWEHL